MFLFCLVFAMFCARLFICALWSPAGKGLTSWLSFVVSSVSLSLSHWYPGSGVVLDCIDSWSLQPYYFAQGHNPVRLERLEPTTPQSQVKNSTIEPVFPLFHSSNENHNKCSWRIWAVACDFQQCGILTSVTQMSLCSLFLSLETPNDVQSVAKQS